MNSAARSQSFPESSYTEDFIDSSKNIPHILLPEYKTPENEPPHKQEDSMVYDLQEFMEAKKEWIKDFFYSKKTYFKKIIGFNEIDKTDTSLLKHKLNNEHEEMGSIEKDILKYPAISDGEILLPLQNDHFISDDVVISKQSETDDLIIPVNFKTIKVDLRKFISIHKQNIKEFVKTNKTEIKEYSTNQKTGIKNYIDNQKIASGRISDSLTEEYKDFISKAKTDCCEYFALKNDELDIFFSFTNEQVRKAIPVISELLKNVDGEDDKRKKNKLFIKAKQNKINEYLSEKEQGYRDYLTERQINLKEFIVKKKNLLKEKTETDKKQEIEFYALIESKKQEINQLITLQTDIIKTFIDSGNTDLSLRAFQNKPDIKEIIKPVTPYINPATLQGKQGLKLNRDTKVLLVEDDLLLKKSLSYFLTHNGFQMVQVSNGLEAMEELHKTKFDLLILDLQMPHMGGMEIIHNVRTQLMLDTKIIVITSSGVEEVELKSFSLGATDFITKPFSPSVLMARIEKITAVA